MSKLSLILSDLDPNNLKHYLNTVDQNDCLPLYYAIKADCLNSVKLLISQGSSLNKTTLSGDPAVHLACLLGVSLDLFEYLLSFESQFGIYKNDQEGWTILHCACNQGHLEIVKYLIEKKHMNPNIKDSKSGYTGLQLAAINNRLGVVEYFLSFATLASIKKEDSVENLIKYKNEKSTIRASDVSLPNIVESSKSQITQSSASSIIASSIHRLRSKSSLKSDKLSIVNENLEKLKSEKKQEESKIFKIKSTKKNLEPTFIYSSETKLYITNLVIDLSSQNNEGQNILHLACLYGKYEIVDLILKKYGSNQVDVNVIDFKGRTCLDLAWDWLLNNQENVSMFYDSENSFYVQRNRLIIDKRVDHEIRLIFLLNKYGAKFSSINILLYNVESLKELDGNSCTNKSDSYFQGEDYVCFDDLKLQSKSIVSIQTYIKCILFILKLNMPTMFLEKNRQT